MQRGSIARVAHDGIELTKTILPTYDDNDHNATKTADEVEEKEGRGDTGDRRVMAFFSLFIFFCIAFEI